MTRLLTPVVAMSLAACGQAGSENGADMVSPTVNETTPSNMTAATPPDGVLLAYRDKYPSEKVEGVAFFDRTLVRRAVARAVGSDSTVTAERLLAMEGPETPIAFADGELTAWRCEAHNCGPHNWSLVVSPDGTRARICYHDDDADPQTLWFEDGKRTASDKDCPSGTT